MEPSSERSSAWLEHLVWDQDVAGSNPVAPTISSPARSQLGAASGRCTSRRRAAVQFHRQSPEPTSATRCWTPASFHTFAQFIRHGSVLGARSRYKVFDWRKIPPVSKSQHLPQASLPNKPTPARRNIKVLHHSKDSQVPVASPLLRSQSVTGKPADFEFGFCARQSVGVSARARGSGPDPVIEIYYEEN